MKNTIYIIFMALITIQFYSLLHASMNTKDKIDEVKVACIAANQNHKKLCFMCQRNDRAESLYSFREGCFDLLIINEQFIDQIGKLALDAHDLNNLEKLNYLCGDTNYPYRKKIITEMVQQGFHPDTIVYRHNDTPMKEATLFEDDEFKSFLIQYGATKK